MSRLSREVVRHLLDAGVKAISVQPSASAIAVDRMLAGMALDPIVALLHAGVVPVLHGDVVVDRARGAAIISTETLFAYLAPILRPRRIILVGEAAVYTADPRRDPAAVPIPIIDETNVDDVLHRTGGSHGVDVTGGMAAKVTAMWGLVSAVDDLDVCIVGPEPEALGPALFGGQFSAGTLIRRRTPLTIPIALRTSGSA
jgi:isopentenyl phosphate kinase